MRAIESYSFREPDILGRPPKEIGHRGARQKANPQNWGTRRGLSCGSPVTRIGTRGQS